MEGVYAGGSKPCVMRAFSEWSSLLSWVLTGVYWPFLSDMMYASVFECTVIVVEMKEKK